MASKFNEDTVTRLEQAISAGATYRLAAGFAGITYQTLRNWIKKGEEAKTGRHKEFVERLRAAESRAAMGWLEMIDSAASQSWQAAAWKLERRYPGDYGRQQVDHHHTGNVTFELKFDDNRHADGSDTP